MLHEGNQREHNMLLHDQVLIMNAVMDLMSLIEP